MKRLIFTGLLMFLVVGSQVFSQDSKALRAARMSFNSAESNYKKANYEEAAREFEIVISTIPAGIDSRKHLKMRLESLVNLIDIYFYRYINITIACTYLEMYFQNMELIRNKGILKASDLLSYQQKERKFASTHAVKCEDYQDLDDDMEQFRQKIEEEIE